MEDPERVGDREQVEGQDKVEEQPIDLLGVMFIKAAWVRPRSRRPDGGYAPPRYSSPQSMLVDL